MEQDYTTASAEEYAVDSSISLRGPGEVRQIIQVKFDPPLELNLAQEAMKALKKVIVEGRPDLQWDS